MPKPGGLRLPVFMGREARLNRAIFKVLAEEAPLTAYEVTKRVRAQRQFSRVKYSVVYRRISL